MLLRLSEIQQTPYPLGTFKQEYEEIIKEHYPPSPTHPPDSSLAAALSLKSEHPFSVQMLFLHCLIGVGLC